MIIILYILGALLLFAVLFLLFILFIRLKVDINGEYREDKAAACMEIFWVKYFLGARCRIKDLHNLHIVFWILGIPLPVRLPLLHREKIAEEKREEKVYQPRFAQKSETEKERPGIKARAERLLQLKEPFQELWQKYRVYVRKIYVRYITISFRSLSANIGLKEPSDTGIAASIYYNILIMSNISNIDIGWNFEKPNFDVALRAKITMKLYGIFFTLLQVYRTHKKEIKNES